MRKVVINRCHGGFSLSDEALALYKELSGYDIPDALLWDYEVARDDPFLVQVVEQIGNKAHGDYAELRIVEIPEDVDFIIQEYDGMEWVAERHRTWS